MAGGKETPRQKMIGMMYLVLTALLALQVSNAVLQKFAIINATLDLLIHDGNIKSSETLAAIIEEAGKNQNPKVLRAKENAQKIRDLTVSTNKSIDEVKKKFLEATGSEKIDEKFINDHGSAVATMMIDKKRKDKMGENFEKLLGDYVKQLSELSGLTFDKLAKAPKEIPIFAEDEAHANKDFLTFTFENTPPVAALASVTQMQTEILEYEAKALEKLRNDAGAGTIRFDKFVPMIRAKSSTVAAGAKFEGTMFLSGSSSAILPEFLMDGKSLEVVTENGVKMGKVEFTAQGGGYDAKGVARKTFKAQIKMNDTTFTEEIEYFVAKPVLRVTTGNAPTLYMNCGNAVNFECPSLGTDFKPSYSSAGTADVVASSTIGKVTIVPKQRKVKITVSSSGINLGTENFDVKPIPRPDYVAKENSGKTLDLKNGVRGSSLTGFRVVAEPDENFKTEVPKDAIYRIRSMEVIHARGTAPINRMTATNENIELGRWRAAFRPGDQIVVEIKTVTRRTFQGQDEKVDVQSEIIRVPLI